MSEQYPDLGITQKQDGDYWDVVIPDLDCSTDYALQAAWVFSDKALGTSEFSDRFNFRTPGPRRTCPINVVAVWDNNTADLKVSWEKPFLEDNVTRDDRIRLFQLTLNAAGEEPIFVPFATKAGVSQYSYTLSQANNMANFGGVFQTTITGKITSIYGDGSSDDCPFTVPVYVDPICVASTLAPTVVSADSSIIVSWQDPATKIGTYRETRVYVSESASPYNWVQRYTGFGPASIPLYTLNTVYVKLNHLSDSGCQSIDSAVVEGKAYDQIVFDDLPPDSIINPSAAWNVRDLDVSFTMPALNLPSYVIVHLTSGTKTRSFEYPISAAASSATSVKITRSKIIDAFGDSPSSFSSGYVTDLDIYRNENLTQVSISGLSTAVKPNLLSGITTTISVTPLANGYSVSSTLNSNATGIKIYQSSTIDGTYALVASSTNSPVIVYDAANAGKTVFIKGEWTSESGAATQSAIATVTILSIADISLINNPVKISTDGSIFTGDLYANGQPIQSGKRMFLNREGLFIYDATSSSPTTQIVGNAATDGLTFITTRAQIANWLVLPSKIENQLSGSSNYTGLAASGSYAFWAGAGVSGGYSANVNDDAKFSVTHSGAVIARNISVLGGNITVGSKFSVSTSGDLIASNVDLSGTIKASSGILGSMDIGGTIKVNGVDTVFPGQLRVVVPGATGGKVEIGQLTTVLGSTVGSGIQVTNTTNGIYAQLDPVNGIIAKKGSIGGWAITDTSINNGENIGFYNTTTSSDIAIWAGGSRTGTPGPNFSITYGGSLVAKEATLSGSIEARSGYFGLYDATSKKITSGWKINGKFLESFIDGSSTVKVKLDGLQGTIAGGNIVGSNVFFWNPTNWYEANDGATSPDPSGWNPETGSGSGNPGNIDYISSSGNFRLAGGKLTYNGTDFKVTTNLVASNVYLGSSSGSTDYLIGVAGGGRVAGAFSLAGGKLTFDGSTFNINLVGANAVNGGLQLVSAGSRLPVDGDSVWGDQTVTVSRSTGYLTGGRVFYYGGNYHPQDRVASQLDFLDSYAAGGDIYLSRKA